MMRTILFTHQDCLGHDTGVGHPERADRLRTVLAALEDERFALLERRMAPLADETDLLRVHTRDNLDSIKAAIPSEGLTALDPDTVISPGSWQAALRAAGAATAAVDAVMAGEARNAFCAVRPPGHHAEAHAPMGFCLLNSVAIGAARARAVHGLSRVAIMDFDVHHGNGTQSFCETRPGFFYASTHQWPLYPGTGSKRETGHYDNVVNLCLPRGSDGARFRAAMEEAVLPALTAFAPDLLMISAGFDGHRHDPVGGLDLEEADYEWATRALMAVADRSAQGRVVSILEGGYNLEALGRSAACHVQALMEG
jgi:acetoin utilization deacetylase AcuC-like enzyme